MVVSDNPFRAKVPIYLFVFQYYVVNAGKYWKTLDETEDWQEMGIYKARYLLHSQNLHFLLEVRYGTKYSRMDQVKFVEDNL